MRHCCKCCTGPAAPERHVYSGRREPARGQMLRREHRGSEITISRDARIKPIANEFACRYLDLQEPLELLKLSPRTVCTRAKHRLGCFRPAPQLYDSAVLRWRQDIAVNWLFRCFRHRERSCCLVMAQISSRSVLAGASRSPAACRIRVATPCGVSAHLT